MKDNKNKPVQVMLTYNAGSSEKNNLRAEVVASDNEPNEEQEDVYLKNYDRYKLIRRYSFDDNGGGYLGL